MRDVLALAAGLDEQWEDTRANGFDDLAHAGWSTWRDGGHW